MSPSLLKNYGNMNKKLFNMIDFDEQIAKAKRNALLALKPSEC